MLIIANLHIDKVYSFISEKGIKKIFRSLV